MNQKKQVKVLTDWAAGRFRPQPIPQNGNGAVNPAHPTETVYKPYDGIECHCPCDFRSLPVESGSVKLIATDIPYDDGWLHEVPEFTAWCADKLANDGCLVTFYGHSHLAECLHLMSKSLVYRWQLVSPIYGVARSYGRFVARYQLAVVFSKSKEWKPRQAVVDILPAGERVPGNHPHRKTVPQMQFIIEAFSDEQNLVVDPCAGSFTTGIASHMTCRRFIGGEKEAMWMAEAKEDFDKLLRNHQHQ